MIASPSQAQRICSTLDTLKSERLEHETVWKDCFDYTYPRRGEGLQGSTLDTSAVNAAKARLVDNTATDGARTLAAAIMSGMTPANSLWVGYDASGDPLSRSDRQWLDNAARVDWKAIHAATWDADGYEAILDIVTAGWGCLYVEEGEGGGLRFEQWPIAQVYATSSRRGAPADIVYRSFSLTAEQAVNEYGYDALGTTLRKAYDSGARDKFPFVHAIEPRRNAAGGPFARNMPIASVHVSIQDKLVVRESGYPEMPAIVARWMSIPQSSYGDGPVFDALPTIKRLNELGRLELGAADLAVGGLFKATEDGVFNPRTVKIGGGRKVVIVGDMQNFDAVKPSTDFRVSDNVTLRLQQQIRRVLMADQLEMHEGPVRTATEVHARMGLLRQLLGPVYGRLQAELHARLVLRVFGLAQRAGAHGQMPESLRNRMLSIRFESPLARAQKLEEVNAIERLFADATAIAQAKPEVLDNLDEDAAIRYVSDALVVPHSILRTEGALRALRADREERDASGKQQAAAEELAMKGARTAASKFAAGMVQ